MTILVAPDSFKATEPAWLLPPQSIWAPPTSWSRQADQRPPTEEPGPEPPRGDLSAQPNGRAGTGAAGGLSGGVWANFGADLVSGAEAVPDAAAFDEQLASAVAVVVGEGRLDTQTGQGKIISAILARVRKVRRRLPVVAVVGSVADDLGAYAQNFTEILIATDASEMYRAGRSIAGYSSLGSSHDN